MNWLEKESGDWFEWAIITCIAIIVLFVGVFQPYMEMRAFNKFSKVKATFFDAVFSELRVTPQ